MVAHVGFRNAYQLKHGVSRKVHVLHWYTMPSIPMANGKYLQGDICISF